MSASPSDVNLDYPALNHQHLPFNHLSSPPGRFDGCVDWVLAALQALHSAGKIKFNPQIAGAATVYKTIEDFSTPERAKRLAAARPFLTVSDVPTLSLVDVLPGSFEKAGKAGEA